MTNAIIAALSEFPASAVKSITCTASSIPQAETFPEFPLPPKKKPGVDQRQAKKVLWFLKTVDLFHLSLKNCCT